MRLASGRAIVRGFGPEGDGVARGQTQRFGVEEELPGERSRLRCRQQRAFEQVLAIALGDQFDVGEFEIGILGRDGHPHHLSGRNGQFATLGHFGAVKEMSGARSCVTSIL